MRLFQRSKATAEKLSVMEVSKLSGVGRATINQKHDPDWVKVREVIKGTTHSGVYAKDSSEDIKSHSKIHKKYIID